MQPPMMWPPPPPKPTVPVGALVAVLVVVAVTVGIVVAAVFFVFISPPIGSHPPTRPVITVSTSEAVTNGFSFSIAGVSQTKAASNFKVNFLDGTAAGTTVILPSCASGCTFVVAGNTWTVAYTDVDGGATLTPGDIFTATRIGGPVVGHTYHVLIFWVDGAQLADAEFQA